MRRTFIVMSLSLLWAGCSGSNPVSPTKDTIQSDNLQVTFSIPQSSYGVHDTLVTTTTVYNPGDTTISLNIPVCWATSWYTVQSSSGATKLSYTAPKNLGCNSIVHYSIQAHQSQQIFMLDVRVPVAALDTTQSPAGSYVLKDGNVLGTFSLGFTVK